MHLVSSSVEGLQARACTLSMATAIYCPTPPAMNQPGSPERRWNISVRWKRDIETRIQTMLERIVGVNKAVVRVEVPEPGKIETD